MLNLKKIGLIALGSMIIFGNNLVYVQGGLTTRDHNESKWNQNINRPSDGKIDNVNISNVDPISSGTTVMSNRSLGILQLPESTNYESELGYAIALIQIAVNRTMTMISVVTLIYILYNGFLILTSGADNKGLDKGKKGIRTAAIAIAGIAISWLIISIILRLIKSNLVLLK